MDHQLFGSHKLKIDTSKIYQKMMENSHATCILLLDKNGTILDSNIGIQKSFGYSREEILGRNFSLFFVPEDRLKRLPEIELATVIQKGSSEDSNYIQHKDGSKIWVHGESVFVKEGDDIIIIKIIFDINQQKLLETYLLKSEQQLLKKHKQLVLNNTTLTTLVEELERFIYTASHDLKAPITNIDGLIDKLFEVLSEDRKKEKDIEMILNLLKQSSLTFRNTITELATIAKDQAESNEDESDLKQIIEEIKNDLRQQIEDLKAEVITQFTNDHHVKLSKRNARSLILNLLSNAIKFRSPERKPVIKISLDRIDGFSLLKVSDNGIGIKEEDKGRIFGLYERLTENVEGSGVGLNLVAKIVNQNGGKILIDSDFGKGSTFSIFLKGKDNQ